MYLSVQEGGEMREYKFRGKSILTSEWVYGYLVQSKPFADGTRQAWIIPESIMPFGAISTPTKNFKQVDPETVGQFICARDKSGKEIYEGDYKLHCGKRAVCVYDESRCRYVCILKLENRESAFVYEILPDDEVAGNIHEAEA
jgi:hypothetical protein